MRAFTGRSVVFLSRYRSLLIRYRCRIHPAQPGSFSGLSLPRRTTSRQSFHNDHHSLTTRSNSTAKRVPVAFKVSPLIDIGANDDDDNDDDDDGDVNDSDERGLRDAHPLYLCHSSWVSMGCHCDKLSINSASMIRHRAVQATKLVSLRSPLKLKCPTIALLCALLDLLVTVTAMKWSQGHNKGRSTHP